MATRIDTNVATESFLDPLKSIRFAPTYPVGPGAFFRTNEPQTLDVVIERA